MFRWLSRLFSKPVRTYNAPQCYRDRDSEEDERDVFRFAPELFEVRTDVIGKLSERGFDWLSHYSSVDPIHDTYGIEVCGIHDRDDAVAIRELLTELFPDWRPG